MAFREVRVFEVREVLRLWLAGEGFRSIERLSLVDRKTVRRYVDAAEALGLDRGGGFEQLSDVFVGMVVEAVRHQYPELVPYLAPVTMPPVAEARYLPAQYGPDLKVTYAGICPPVASADRTCGRGRSR